MENDRSTGVGGGVCLCNDNSVNCLRLTTPDKFFNLRLLCVDMFADSVKQCFILCYNPCGVVQHI